MKNPTMTTKNSIKIIVQFFIILYTMTTGFWFTYLYIWAALGLPLVWWAMLITVALAVLSMVGFYRWIIRGNSADEK